METSQQQASMRQIHAAIDHLYKAEFEAAITLASAAEGVLPDTEKPHLFQKIKNVAESLPADASGANTVNAIANWTKHGTRPAARISEQDVIEVVTRAISKFIAVYGAQSAEMKAFSEWATQRLQAGNSN